MTYIQVFASVAYSFATNENNATITAIHFFLFLVFILYNEEEKN